MEFRKEKSDKSKKLIREQLKSDIFNIKTGYYKTEKIFPVSPKPNESRENINEFIPKYKEIKHYERHFINLLSDQQKHNPNITKLKPNHSQKNAELEIVRNRSKEIKKNCYGQNGTFSAKKLYYYDIFKKEDMSLYDENKGMNKSRLYKSNSKSIKQKRNESKQNLFNNTILLKKNKAKLQLNKINNIEQNENKNSLYTKYRNNNINKKNNNKKGLRIDISPFQKSENLNIINWTIKPYYNKTYKRNNNMNAANKKFYKINPIQLGMQKIQSQKVFYGHPKDLTKVFSTESFQPKRNNIKKIKKKSNEETEYFNILLQKIELDRNVNLIDDKKLKQIFYNNGLHVYDINEDGMNNLFKEKKIEAKLRKNKIDEDFDRNYRKVIKELQKYNIMVDKIKMIDEKGFKNQNSIKKRKGTPGTALHKKLDTKELTKKLDNAFYENK